MGVGAGWAVAFDAATWLAAAVILAKVELPPKPRRDLGSSTVEDLREGWSYFRSTTWLWAVVLAFGPLGAAFGYRDVLVVSGVAYAVISLACLTSRSVRGLSRVTPAEAAATAR